MNWKQKIQWNEALSLTDAALVREADPSRISAAPLSSRRRRNSAIAAAAVGVLVVLGVAVATVGPMLGVSGGTEPAESGNQIIENPPATPPGGAITPDPTGRGLWTYVSSYEATSFQRTAPGNIVMTLSYSAPTMDGEEYLAVEDACSVLFGQYVSSLYAFDYDAHFKLFPASLVEAEFVSRVAGDGLSYEAAIERITALAERIIGFERFDLAYEVATIDRSFPGDVGYDALFDGYAGWFERAGVPIGEIEEVRRYVFEDVRITVNGTYTQVGPIGLEEDGGYLFFLYKGQWHLWPSSIENDMSVDMALTGVSSDAYLQEAEASGIITAMEGDYISLGGRKRFLRPDAPDEHELKVGDAVTLRYYELGVSLGTEEGEVTLHRVISVTRGENAPVGDADE